MRNLKLKRTMGADRERSDDLVLLYSNRRVCPLLAYRSVSVGELDQKIRGCRSKRLAHGRAGNIFREQQHRNRLLAVVDSFENLPIVELTKPNGVVICDPLRGDLRCGGEDCQLCPFQSDQGTLVLNFELRKGLL